jgi:hypothetical protein
MNKMVVINAANGLNYIKTGENIVAVEMHSADPNTLGLAFDAQLTDNKNTFYFKLGSDWKYNDGGITPQAQIRDKVTDVAQRTEDARPATVRLYQNYPNPFNPATVIEFSLAETAKVSLVLYSVRGQIVGRLVDDTLTAGLHRVTWDSKAMANGVYFYELRAGSFREMHKAVVMR